MLLLLAAVADSNLIADYGRPDFVLAGWTPRLD